MKYLKLFAVFGALALAGAGSATLLDVFGTVSGTADVEPALEIGTIESNSIEVTKNMDGDFTSSAELTANGTTEIVGDVTSDSEEISFSEDVLSGSYDVSLEIEDNQVDSEVVN
jgi:hypothetical protein